MEQNFNICDYGAVPDGKTLCTEAIQEAIDDCHRAGGGQVLCRSGTFLTGSVELKSNVELHLTAGCRIVGSTSLDDYDDFTADGFRGEYAPERSTKSLIQAKEAENIAITGPGTIDGSGTAFYDTENYRGRFFAKPDNQRPRLVMFYNCTRIRLENTSFVDSPCWTFWLMKCEQVGIHQIRIRGDQRMINNDGINLDSCRDVTVSDCIIKTGDDCLVLRAIRRVHEDPGVCENITIVNCVLDSWCQGIRVGCPGDGVIRNSTFSNLVITANNGILIEHPRRYLSGDRKGTADIHGILFSQISINSKNTPVKVFVEDGIRLPRVSDIRFSDIRIKSGGPCQVEGSPETTIKNVSFSNVDIETSGEDAVCFRHCQGIKLTNVELTNRPAESQEPA